MSKDKFVVVQVNDELQVKKFIADLREAIACSRDTGGLYSAFLPLKNGQILQVEVALSIEPKG